MTLKMKMFSTVGVVTLLLIALGLITHYQFGAYEALAQSRVEIGEVESHLLQMRRFEKDFLARSDMRYTDDFDHQHGELIEHIGSLERLLTELGIPVDTIEQVRSGVREYVSQFHQLVELQRAIGLTPNDGLRGTLRAAVHDAEAIFEDVSDWELAAKMLTLRRIEKDFLMRHDTQYVEEFAAAGAAMQSALNDTPSLSQEQRIQAAKLMATYAESFRALVDDERAIGLSHDAGARGQLRTAVHAAESLVESLEAQFGEQIGAARQSILLALYASLATIILVTAGLLGWLGWSISRRAAQAAYNMRQIAEGDGDLTRRLDARGNDEFADLADAFNAFAGKIHDMIKRVARMAASLSETSSHVSDAASATDDSMRSLRGNTQSVVVATEEMSATARDVAQNASQVSSASRDADAVAVKGRETVQQSVQSINNFANEFSDAAATIAGLRTETENIGGILDVIRGIAEQTNLLALNAAIEAARAGEQGRGFAVVADEVRTLAHRSQQSTSEIQDLISRLQEQAESAVSMIQHGQSRIGDTVTQAGEAGAALAHITEAIGTIAGMTEQIATAAEEQSAVVNDISSNVVSIDELAQSTTHHADTTTDLADRLASAMYEVTNELKHFRFENDQLLVLAQARAAHFDWKSRLRAFLDGRSELSSKQISSHEHCNLGKWYYSEGVERFGQHAEFRAIEEPHRAIHQAIRQVVEAKERGDAYAAEQAYERVRTLSDEVVMHIDRLAESVS